MSGRVALCGLGLVIGLVARPQDSTRTVEWSAYLEPYFAYDVDGPGSGERPPFLYNHVRTSEFNVNLGLVQAAYSGQRVRGTIGLMAGTYVQYNMVNEAPALRHVHEASIGYKLSRSRELWLDAGIFPSHIGAESAIGAENPTLTRSLMAEGSAYYEAGLKLNYGPSDKWSISVLVLNGWQRIQRQAGNTTPAFGTQVLFEPDDRLTVNWSTFFGSDVPDSVGLYRAFSDLYATYGDEQRSATMAVDVGIQQSSDPDGAVDGWLTLAAIYRERFLRNWWVVGRMEYFLDDGRIILDRDVLLGGSLGVDRELTRDLIWRFEARLFSDPDQGFLDADEQPKGTNLGLTTSLCLTL
ncbi:MAG: porin [Flavobacteriales bacterium]|nr:porin [Flavobacteriales bacterium]